MRLGVEPLRLDLDWETTIIEDRDLRMRPRGRDVKAAPLRNAEAVPMSPTSWTIFFVGILLAIGGWGGAVTIRIGAMKLAITGTFGAVLAILALILPI